jgi:hypothetical protein
MESISEKSLEEILIQADKEGIRIKVLDAAYEIGIQNPTLPPYQRILQAYNEIKFNSNGRRN